MNNRLGYVYGFAAYLCWGAFPFFFALLSDVDPLEVVPWRVITALVFCVIAVSILRVWQPVAAIFRSRRTFWWFVLCTVLLYANWQIFVIGVITGRILETALGYFINPLMTILIGVLVRKERLSRLQWIAVSIAAVGVIVSSIAYGKFPYIALGVAVSFALYGAVRKQVSQDIDALTGLTVETLIGTVIALAQLGVLYVLFGHLGAFDHGPAVTIPLMLSGVVTAIPLLLFAAGTRRLPLTHMGFIQFLTPVLGFFTGYFLFDEQMTTARWIGFIAVWIALVFLVTDMLMSLRNYRRTSSATEPPAVTGEILAQPLP